MPSARLTLLGKPGCHLCDEARDVVTRVIADLDVSVTLNEVSILDDPALTDRYWDEIPVVLVGDRVHTIWRVDPDRLRTAILEGSERSSTSSCGN